MPWSPPGTNQIGVPGADPGHQCAQAPQATHIRSQHEDPVPGRNGSSDFGCCCVFLSTSSKQKSLALEGSISFSLVPIFSTAFTQRYCQARPLPECSGHRPPTGLVTLGNSSRRWIQQPTAALWLTEHPKDKGAFTSTNIPNRGEEGRNQEPNDEWSAGVAEGSFLREVLGNDGIHTGPGSSATEKAMAEPGHCQCPLWAAESSKASAGTVSKYLKMGTEIG